MIFLATIQNEEFFSCKLFTGYIYSNEEKLIFRGFTKNMGELEELAQFLNIETRFDVKVS